MAINSFKLGINSLKFSKNRSHLRHKHRASQQPSSLSHKRTHTSSPQTKHNRVQSTYLNKQNRFGNFNLKCSSGPGGTLWEISLPANNKKTNGTVNELKTHVRLLSKRPTHKTRKAKVNKCCPKLERGTLPRRWHFFWVNIGCRKEFDGKKCDENMNF